MEKLLKKDLRLLLEKAERFVHNGVDSTTADFVRAYVEEAEREVSMLKRGSSQLNSSQREIYNKLAAAIGPGHY